MFLAPMQLARGSASKYQQTPSLYMGKTSLYRNSLWRSDLRFTDGWRHEINYVVRMDAVASWWRSRGCARQTSRSPHRLTHREIPRFDPGLT